MTNHTGTSTAEKPSSSTVKTRTGTGGDKIANRDRSYSLKDRKNIGSDKTAEKGGEGEKKIKIALPEVRQRARVTNLGGGKKRRGAVDGVPRRRIWIQMKESPPLRLAPRSGREGRPTGWHFYKKAKKIGDGVGWVCHKGTRNRSKPLSAPGYSPEREKRAKGSVKGKRKRRKFHQSDFLIKHPSEKKRGLYVEIKRR